MADESTMRLGNSACLLVAAGLLAVAFGCQRYEEKVDDLDVARHLMNHRRYDEATTLLERLLREDPANDYLRIVLASSLSGSVGINTIDSYEALRTKLFDKPLVRNVGIPSDGRSLLEGDLYSLSAADESTNSEAENPAEVVRKFEREMLKFFGAARDAFHVAFKLPHTPDTDRPRLMRAINLLLEVKDNSPQFATAQLYVAILDLVQFMNYLRDAVPMASLDDGQDAWYLTVYCSIEVDKFLTSLFASSHFLAHGISALGNARRTSDNPVNENLELLSMQLVQLNDHYSQYQDVISLTDLAHSISKYAQCN